MHLNIRVLVDREKEDRDPNQDFKKDCDSDHFSIFFAT